MSGLDLEWTVHRMGLAEGRFNHYVQEIICDMYLEGKKVAVMEDRRMGVSGLLLQIANGLNGLHFMLSPPHLQPSHEFPVMSCKLQSIAEQTDSRS